MIAFAISSLQAQKAAGARPIPVAPQPPHAAASQDVAEFQELEDKWADAVVNKNQYAMELILAPSYVGIDGVGAVTDRGEQIAQIFARSSAKQTIEFKVVSVRPLADAAVVNGTYILHLKKDTGDDSGSEKGIFTHVFQRSKGAWLCINAQRTIVANPGAPNGKPRRKN